MVLKKNIFEYFSMYFNASNTGPPPGAGQFESGDLYLNKSRKKKKTSETDSIKFKISSKTPRGKKDSTKKDTIIDITSDSHRYLGSVIFAF